MADLRRSVTPSHLELLLQYMERDRALALAGPRSRHDQLQARKFWEKVAKTLNKVDGKVVKTGKGWCRYWADLKCKTRRKMTTKRASKRELTAWERRVVALLTDERGDLLPNAHQLPDTEYLHITKPSMEKIRKTSYSDEAQSITPETNTQTYEQTDKIYIVNHIEHRNGHKTKIDIGNIDENMKVRSSREEYTITEHNNSAQEHNNSAKDQYNSKGHVYIEVEQNNTTTDHNSIEELTDNTTELMYSTTEHNNSTTVHSNSIAEHMCSRTESKTKTVEELKKEILEFQLKRQKELFKMEKRERSERHKLEIGILRLKRDILVKELNDKT